MTGTGLDPLPLGAGLAIVELPAEPGRHHLVAPGEQEDHWAVITRQCLHQVMALAQQGANR